MRHAEPRSGQMIRVDTSTNGELVFALSGRICTENIAELEGLCRSVDKNPNVVMDLKNVTLVNNEAVAFLSRCEAAGFFLRNCPTFIREWIRRQKKHE